MQHGAPGHDDGPDDSGRSASSPDQHPLSGKQRGTIEPPELRDVVAFSVHFGSHNEPQLAVVHQSDLLSQRAVAPPDGRYSKVPSPHELPPETHRASSGVPTVRHYTATLHEIVEREPVAEPRHRLSAPPAAPARPRGLPLLVGGVVVAAVAFGYLMGRQQPAIEFANLAPTGAGPAAKAAAVGPGLDLSAAAQPAPVLAQPAPAVPAAQALPAVATLAPAQPAAVLPAPAVVTMAQPAAAAAVPVPVTPVRVRQAVPGALATAAAPALVAAPAAVAPAVVACTEKVAALGLCELRP